MNREYDNYNEPCCPGSLARACVPFQKWNEIYSPSEALKKGTLYPDLYKPYKVNVESRMGGRYYG